MMAEEQGTSFEAVVLRDSGGEYYLLPLEVLEQTRVPAEHKAELERLVPELANDTVGFADPRLTYGQAIYWGHILIMSGSTDAGLRLIRLGVQSASGGGRAMITGA